MVVYAAIPSLAGSDYRDKISAPYYSVFIKPTGVISPMFYPCFVRRRRLHFLRGGAIGYPSSFHCFQHFSVRFNEKGMNRLMCVSFSSVVTG